MNVSIMPEGREFLSFSYNQPSDWLPAELPVEEPKFDDPKYFAPLAAAVSPDGAGAFTVGVRMGYSDGTLREWLDFLCREDNIKIDNIREFSADGIRGLRFDARQTAWDITMCMRNLYIEDGGRLYAICSMAAEADYPLVQTTLAEMTESFRPAEVAGPTVAQDAEELGTLNPEHPVNRKMRDNGVGLVPRVVRINPAKNFAEIAAGAITATLRVPLGWHAIDDGRRTLLFHTQSNVQINLDCRPKDGAQAGELLDAILASYRAEQPAIQGLRLELGGMPALAFRNFLSGGEMLEQVFLLKEGADAATVLCARVTAPNGQMSDALDVAEIVLSSVQGRNTIQ